MMSEEEIRARLIKAYRIYWLYRVLDTGIERQCPKHLAADSSEWAGLRQKIVKTANLIKAEYAAELDYHTNPQYGVPVTELEFGRVIGEWQTLSEVLAPDETMPELAGIEPGKPLPELPNFLMYKQFPMMIPGAEFV
jgi:hypothetical protein